MGKIRFKKILSFVVLCGGFLNFNPGRAADKLNDGVPSEMRLRIRYELFYPQDGSGADRFYSGPWMLYRQEMLDSLGDRLAPQISGTWDSLDESIELNSPVERTANRGISGILPYLSGGKVLLPRKYLVELATLISSINRQKFFRVRTSMGTWIHLPRELKVTWGDVVVLLPAKGMKGGKGPQLGIEFVVSRAKQMKEDRSFHTLAKRREIFTSGDIAADDFIALLTDPVAPIAQRFFLQAPPIRRSEALPIPIIVLGYRASSRSVFFTTRHALSTQGLDVLVYQAPLEMIHQSDLADFEPFLAAAERMKWEGRETFVCWMKNLAFRRYALSAPWIDEREREMSLFMQLNRRLRETQEIDVPCAQYLRKRA